MTPPPGLPRRMFAGGRLKLADRPLIGERLMRTERVVASTDKRGRSGPLRFVTAEYRLTRPDGTEVLTEQQDIVYRAAPVRAATDASGGDRPAAQVPASPPGALLTPQGPLRAQLQAGPVELQRFSAATSNPHRIHYDYPYVTAVEGYPGLLVHGPLLLLAMLELIRLRRAGREVSEVAFTARAPVFAGQPVALRGSADDAGGLRLTARSPAGTTAMTCEVTFCEAS